jgi:hypothetical protein
MVHSLDFDEGGSKYIHFVYIAIEISLILLSVPPESLPFAKPSDLLRDGKQNYREEGIASLVSFGI